MHHLLQPSSESSQPRFSGQTDGYRLSPAAWRLDPGVHEALVTCATSAVCRLQDLIRRAIDDESWVASMLGWPATVRPSDAWGGEPDVGLGCHRCDTIYAEGRWHIVEINLMNAGGWIVPRLYREVVDPNPTDQPDPAALLLEHIVGACSVNRSREAGLVVLIRQRPSEEFCDRFISRCREAIAGAWPGWRLAYACWDDLNFCSEGAFFETLRVDAILELEVAASLKRLQAQHLATKDQLILIPGPSAGLANDKRWLVELAREPGSTIPTTLALGSIRGGVQTFTQALLTQLIEDRPKFVLKKAHSDGGVDVFAGRSNVVEPWRALVARALAEGDWVVQSWIEPERPTGEAHGAELPSDAHLIFSPFVIGGHYAGGFVRILRADGYHRVRRISAAPVSIADTQNGDALIPLFPILPPVTEQYLI